mmetsp:Transcript_49137/g.117044  ORF Transcript_49137/g.117044 Transcript_49137/m.117044 type:complete len:282 (-) Transcript_49137:183-1028(-)|eukprot:CAMPEP_0178418776 /NCGR_PEP_ID=MMETSP0689_2-20121128/25265_1 /TAXON_ID=160604 /ORGANISM="Amphidinium massartii, Strain CS-259" /LENGTH=281 /DNA_ID=CAMNT_0020040185 /DNA_START=12 /DNA_END=857 /DNA_ORIENTATION=+
MSSQDEEVPSKDAAVQRVSENGRALEHLPQEWRADRDVVLAAVTRFPAALVFASDSLRADKEVVLRAVTKHWAAFEHAAPTMKADKDVVMKVVSAHGRSLAHASEEVRSDLDILVAAVSQDPMSLDYASAGMKQNMQVVIAAVTKSVQALECVPDLVFSASTKPNLLEFAKEKHQKVFKNLYIFKVTTLSGSACCVLVDCSVDGVVEKPGRWWLLQRCAFRFGLPAEQVANEGKLWRTVGTDMVQMQGDDVSEWGLEPGVVHELQLIVPAPPAAAEEEVPR